MTLTYSISVLSFQLQYLILPPGISYSYFWLALWRIFLFLDISFL